MVANLEIGAFASSIAIGCIGDIIGRRKTILYGSRVFIVGGALGCRGLDYRQPGRVDGLVEWAIHTAPSGQPEEEAHVYWQRASGSLVKRRKLCREGKYGTQDFAIDHTVLVLKSAAVKLAFAMCSDSPSAPAVQKQLFRQEGPL